MLKPPMPFGHELGGVVTAVGEGVTEFKVGDRVVPMNSAPCDACFFCRHGQQNLCDDLLFNNGAYAEYLRVPARIVDKNTLRVPDGVALEHAALTEPLACVIRGLEESGAKPGDSMIVIGAGPIGLMLMHAAELSGIQVTAVVKRAEQAQTARSFGASQVLSIEGLKGEDEIIAAARALTPNARGADVVIEAVATPVTWQWAVGMVRKGGVVNFFGRAAERYGRKPGYQQAALRGHHAEGQLSSHAGDLPDGIYADRERMLQGGGLYHQPGDSGRRAGGVSRAWCSSRRRNRKRDIKTAIVMGLEPELAGWNPMSVAAVHLPVAAALEGAPAEYALPAKRPTLAVAQSWCRHLATAHYENFHVATWFLPKRARPYFESIYAFSRAADDLGDEVADTATATRLLGEWRGMLHECYEHPERSMHPVFVALKKTIDETGVPRQLFDDLITAFERDQVATHHESMESLIDYSRYSANPVGRLVLWVSGYTDEVRGRLSDKVCTGLQLCELLAGHRRGLGAWTALHSRGYDAAVWSDQRDDRRATVFAGVQSDDDVPCRLRGVRCWLKVGASRTRWTRSLP